jgi:Gametolysin peptidase M11
LSGHSKRLLRGLPGDLIVEKYPTVLCHLFVSHTILDTDNNMEVIETSSFHCKIGRNLDEDWRLYSVALPTDFVEENEIYFNYNPVLRITDAQVTKDSIELSPSSTISIHQETSPRRRLAPKTGSPTVLSVYVTGTDGHLPESTIEDIKNGIFGTGTSDTQSSLFKQYNDCSYGALTLQPATLGNVNNGFVQVQVNRPLDSSCSMDSGDCYEDVMTATVAALGRPLTDYDMLMFCLPNGILFGGRSNWAAFAFTGFQYSFFTNGYCSIMSTVGHELGHLMGFGQ